MPLNGAHAIIYSRDADADRGFFQDVLKMPSVDVGGGWLIFGLPPSEVAVHPTEGEGSHELYLMCEDVAAFVKVMTARGMPICPRVSVRARKWRRRGASSANASMACR